MSAVISSPSDDVATVDPELAGIAALCSGSVKYMTEAGLRYIHMEGLRFLVRGKETQMDALLCLNYRNPAYPTKLYLSANLGLGLNWNETAYLLAARWFTWSWRGVSPNQSSLAILAGHLEAFK